MKVVILCGGMGARLREETEFRPKPMVEIGGKPILWHIMKHYAHYGFTDFVLCLGYKGAAIKEYFYHYILHTSDVTLKLGGTNREMVFHENKDAENWTVTLADTGEHTLKGARIKKIERYIDTDSFMLTYGDGISDVDLKKLADFHHSHGKIGTVTGVEPRSSFGQIVQEGDQVLDFIEKPKIERSMVNGGFFVFNRKLFDYLSDREDCDFEIGPLETLTKDGQLMVHNHTGDWACMDTYRDVTHLNKVWDSGKAFWKVWP
jgi:glucose-1-phosphate cytidylyltransferase